MAPVFWKGGDDDQNPMVAAREPLHGGLLGVMAASLRLGATVAAATSTGQSQTSQIPCPSGLPQNAICYQTISSGLGLPTQGPSGGTSPAAPAGASYVYPSVGYDDWYCVGNTCFDRFQIIMRAENWYAGYSVGTVWVTTSCWAGLPWTCQADSHGSFYDSGRAAQTDWDNRNVDFYTAQYTPWLRIWVKANGSWTDAGGSGGAP